MTNWLLSFWVTKSRYRTVMILMLFDLTLHKIHESYIRYLRFLHCILPQITRSFQFRSISHNFSFIYLNIKFFSTWFFFLLHEIKFYKTSLASIIQCMGAFMFSNLHFHSIIFLQDWCIQVTLIESAIRFLLLLLILTFVFCLVSFL